MATIFVSAVDGNNADDGSTWALAKQTVAGALAIAASGDVILVDNAGTFTAGAAITWTPPAGNVAIISVNRSGSDAWAAGAVEEVGNANAAFTVAGAAASSMFVYGLRLNAGSAVGGNGDIALLLTSGVSARLEMCDCTLDVQQASTNAQLALGPISAGATFRSLKIILDGCNIVFSGSRAGSAIQLGEAEIEIINPTLSMTGATKSDVLFDVMNTADWPHLLVRDGDLSGYSVSGGAYFSVTNWAVAVAVVENCKLSGTPSWVTGSWPGGIGSIMSRNVDSGDTINTFEYRDAYGTLTENASIYAASGAEFNGAGISWEITTTAACNEHFPFMLPPITVWNETTTAQTAKLHFVRDSATNITDREAWADLSHPASASFPNYAVASDRNANPFTGTAVDQAASSATWIGTGGFANENKQELGVAFTAAEVGLLTMRAYIAKASTTLYVDPIIHGVGGSGDVVWLSGEAHQLPDAGAGGGLLAHPGMRGGFV